MQRSTARIPAILATAVTLALLAPPGRADDARSSTAPPRVISGRILTPTVDVRRGPATPAVRFRYSAPAGLAFIAAVFRSPFGQTYNDTYTASAPADKSGLIVVQEATTPMSLYARPGVWSINSVTIADFAGRQTTYSGNQLGTLFSSVTINVINNGTFDATLPTISAGKLLTPKVSLSSATPFFEAELTVADNLSGVSLVVINLLGPHPGAVGSALVFPSAPIVAPGTAVAGFNMSHLRSAVGTWTISNFLVCDLAANCVFDDNPAHMKRLFGTTIFELTQ